ncbi:MAG: DUF2304 domain-containing protein [Acidobacteria bacterium]|nr:DUF2304 domain-containing protein [Acidobacteriota bacterium]
MQDLTNLDELRTMLLSAPESRTTAVLAIGLSLVLLGTVLFMVRRRALREELTPIWIAVALGITIISLRMDLLRWITRQIGAWTPSSTLFFMGEVFLVCICLDYAVRLSRSSLQIRILAQETAVLRARLDRLEGEAPAAGLAAPTE